MTDLASETIIFTVHVLVRLFPVNVTWSPRSSYILIPDVDSNPDAAKSRLLRTCHMRFLLVWKERRALSSSRMSLAAADNGSQHTLAPPSGQRAVPSFIRRWISRRGNGHDAPSGRGYRRAAKRTDWSAVDSILFDMPVCSNRLPIGLLGLVSVCIHSFRLRIQGCRRQCSEHVSGYPGIRITTRYPGTRWIPGYPDMTRTSR